jgi:hypothetical protein
MNKNQRLTPHEIGLLHIALILLSDEVKSLNPKNIQADLNEIRELKLKVLNGLEFIQ